jgi:hypothetical protein
MRGRADSEPATGDFTPSAIRKFLSIKRLRDSLRNAIYSSIAMEDRIPAFESVDDVMVGVYRDMKPEKRLEIALGMWLSARQMLYEAIRSFHSDWTEDQVERTVAERMLRGST